MRPDFKATELPAAPTGDADTGPPVPSGPAPQAEDGRPVGGVFKMSPGAYEAIVANQRGAEWWPNRDDLELAREWSHIFIRELKLRVKDAEFLGVPLIRIEKLNVRHAGRVSPRARRLRHPRHHRLE